MSYQAFYRKFRPNNFREVKGQEHIVTTLKNQIKSDRVGHAYLFCGTRGTGKTTIAKIFARAVNCEHPTEDGPCNQCPTCISIQQQTSMNVVEIDAASNNRVDDIRQVIEEVQYSPSEGEYKVYIIDEVHMLSTSAFNALLKTLEEPPSYLIFILATTEAHKIPLTILSRCQRYDFKRISVDTITELLEELLAQEGIEAEKKALQYIAKAADGAARDGLSLLEQCVSFYYGETLTYEKVLKVLGVVDQRVYITLMEALASHSVKEVVGVLEDVILRGKDLTQFTIEFVWFLRNVLLVKTSNDASEILEMSAENLADIKKVSGSFEGEMILRYIRIFSDLSNQMRFATGKRVLLEVALIKLCCPEMERDYDSLVARIHKLEERLEKGDFQPSEKATSIKRKSAEVEVKKEVKLPKAIPEEVAEVARNWDAIVATMSPVWKGMIRSAKLSVGADNHLQIVFIDEVSAGFFKDTPEKLEELETKISNQIQKQVKVDIRVAVNREEHDSLPTLKDLLGIASGVEIKYLD